MNDHPRAEAAQTALLSRLRAVTPFLVDSSPDPAANPAAASAALLDQLARHVFRSRSRKELWLLLTAVAAAFPDDDELTAAWRELDLASDSSAPRLILERGFELAAGVGAPLSSLDVVSNALVIDVGHVAVDDLHTGIQRVVRETLPRWSPVHEFVLTAWTAGWGAMRALQNHERLRVLNWGQPAALMPEAMHLGPPRLLVPWKSVVLLPELAEPARAHRLSTLARHSGNRLVAIGYDCIPVISADTLLLGASDDFGAYLAMIKNANKVVAISSSAKTEFSGFVSMLPVQGLSGPSVVECRLPVEIPSAPTVEPTAADIQGPLVLVVGSHEPRKNHLGVLFAAESLWREGLRFRLRFIGGSGWLSEPFDRWSRQLEKSGRPIEVLKAVTDDDLWASYREARFTVFPSFHEGYGLPVAESLASGTPVITSDFGSTMEIVAAGGGGIVLDPHDDIALTSAFRDLLTDHDLLERLRAECARRPLRTWDDYAADLWLAVDSELAAVR